MCESTVLERSSLEGLFRAFRIILRCLMRLFVAVACISAMSRHPTPANPPPPPVLRAEQSARARAFVRTPDVDHSDLSRYGGPASGSGEQRSVDIPLFGSLNRMPSADRRTEREEHPWELNWWYGDHAYEEFVPYAESVMRRWWDEVGQDPTNVFGSYGPMLLVRLRSWSMYLPLHEIYDMGVPPTWRPSTRLLDHTTIVPPKSFPPPPPPQPAKASQLPEPTTPPKAKMPPSPPPGPAQGE